jgi:hypothetical protein
MFNLQDGFSRASEKGFCCFLGRFYSRLHVRIRWHKDESVNSNQRAADSSRNGDLCITHEPVETPVID